MSTQDEDINPSAPCLFRRNLGTSEAFSIIINIVIGSGIFTSLGAIDTDVPSPGAALVVWFVGGILAWTGAATMAELRAAIPGEGGVQQYLQYISGEAFGFLAGWTWVVAVVPASLAILSIVFVESIYSATGLIISIANSVSTQFSMRLNTFFFTTMFAAIAVTVVAGLGVVFYHLASWDRDHSREPQDWEIEWQKLQRWESLGHYPAALCGALWAYSGWDKAIYVSAELFCPARQLPLTINTAVPTVILSFIAVNIAYYILLPWSLVSTTDSAIAAGLICLVVAGSLLGSSFVAGRIVVAAANPTFLARVGTVSGRSTSTADAPINAIFFSTTCSIVYIYFENFRVLATFSGLSAYIFLFLTMVGAIILRVREPELPRPYKPTICVAVVFALVSGCVVARGAVFAPVQAVVLIGLWLVGLGLYSARRQWIGKGEAESSEQ
ncbi:hypothetical protein ASPFODRAFT_56512 [Aspergillus luchuensis CBS 106.47]|uniref:Amino acid permease/ SLC12A domain-containing protein n=1 Tax=Aspergillus luchuensis (strain CBS 106.47) TaxID=1137211 RepID=A0A1M3TTF7_ASPLC|nr:hypothetical protein ASPFODRAFT_56512 [Aspergillus luchuensis CBS 106.47]